jgi:hypothetical protein
MHRFNEFNYFIKNGPIPVNFAGLRGNTRAMQADGWELSIENHRSPDRDTYQIRLAGRHKGMNLRTVSMPQELPAYLMEMRQIGLTGGGMPQLEFSLYVVCESISFMIPERAAPPVFRSADFSSPMLTEFNAMKHINLDECAFFKTYDDSADIYIPKEDLWTTEKHLLAIRDLQKDKQTELRAKARKAEASSRGEHFREYQEEREIKLQLIAI